MYIISYLCHYFLYRDIFRLAVQNIPNHPEYKTADVAEKQLARKQCKEIFPVIEELKLNLKKRYAAQYRIHLEEQVSVLYN